MVKRSRVLHIWDYRVSSGNNIDDLFLDAEFDNISIARVLTTSKNNQKTPIDFLLKIDRILSPYPQNLVTRQLSYFYYYLKIFKSSRQSYQLVVFHFGQTAARYISQFEKRGVPWICFVYGHDLSAALSSFRWKFKYKIFAKSRGKFLVLADAPKNELIKLGVSPNRISKYDFPLNFDQFYNVAKMTSEDIFTLLIPGRLVEKKGHSALFQALRNLKEAGIFVNLLVLGYGPLKCDLVELAQHLQIDDQITWIDSEEKTLAGEFPSLYAETLSRSNLVVTPSITSVSGDSESGPALVNLFAQAAGVPVLTSSFSGHEISIFHRETGLVLSEVTPEEIARNIEWTMGNPKTAESIGLNGRNFIQSNFDSSISELEKLFIEIMKG
jgi:glycosyltransferase involved in cell wall biosynthesis